jgi:glycosyltransferase involved in cell wall biosynthesis
MKKALLIAFHFPPMTGSSGLQRALKLCRYLSDFGWQSLVLTATDGAYPNLSTDLLNEIPESVKVHRTFAFDAARHLSVRGRHVGFMCYPDRWWSWAFSAIPAGKRLIAQEKPDLIWSTHPIPTSQFIGLSLARWSGVPLVADIRDPMVEPGVFPESPVSRRMSLWIEQRLMRSATRVVVTAPGLKRQTEARYPKINCALVPNGFDEENFLEAEASIQRVSPSPHTHIEMVHSGLLHSAGRDLTKFFSALSSLKRKGLISADQLRVKLRATGNDEQIQRQVNHFFVTDLVTLCPPIPYVKALEEMLMSDAMLLVQDSSCNDQIPAKLYEYFRAGKPILALTDPRGDTARAVIDANAGHVAPLDDANSIEQSLMQWLPKVRDGSAARPSDALRRQYSRHMMAQRFAQIFDEVVPSMQVVTHRKPVLN